MYVTTIRGLASVRNSQRSRIEHGLKIRQVSYALVSFQELDLEMRSSLFVLVVLRKGMSLPTPAGGEAMISDIIDKNNLLVRWRSLYN